LILLSLKEIPETRFREIYGGRRIEDKAVFGGELTQPLNASGSDIVYEQLPLQSEVILDFGRMFNRLNVKEFDGKLLGQTLDREDILAAIDPRIFSSQGMVVAPNTRNAWGRPTEPFIYAPIGVDADNGFIEAQRLSGLFGSYTQASGSGNSYTAPSLVSLTQSAWNAVQADKNMLAQLMIRGYSSTSRGATYKTGVHLAPAIGNSWTGGVDTSIDKNSAWSKARFTYGRSSDEGVTMTEAVKANLEACGHARTMYPSGGSNGGSSYKDNELALDWFANAHVHSSALSFIAQYHDSLIRIASQTQYLASELVGFYEKGLKGDFLRHYNPTDVQTMFALVELGAALRRQQITRNCGHLPASRSDARMIVGTMSPFFMYVEKFGDNKVKRMYTPWWLTMLLDRHYFEYDDTVDDVRDIHREDLFQGIRVLLEAASLEYGMIVKSTGTPYLEFFKDFESAVLPDYKDFGSVPSLRSLWYAGFCNAEDYANLEEPEDAGYSFFREFIKGNKIVETERLDLQKDYAEMDTLSVITGDMFKLGQQLLGQFEYSTHHRLTRFGSKSVDVKVRPDMAWRPLSYRNVIQSSDKKLRTAVAGTGFDYESAPGTPKDSAAILAAYKEALENANMFIDWIAFPSLRKGWSSKLHNVAHEMNDVAMGYGHIRSGSALSKQTTFYPTIGGSAVAGSPVSAQDVKYYGMGDLPAANVSRHFYNDVSGGARNHYVWSFKVPVPLAPAAYWRLGTTGMLGSFVLRMNKVYQAWQGRTSGLFRRSELKNLLSFGTYNLARELKMDTPDAYLAKNAEDILGMMGCGASGFSPAFALRTVERKLENALVHARSSTGVYGNGGVDLDADLLINPFAGDANNVEDMFFSQHLIAYLTGLYSENLLNLTVPASYFFRKDSDGNVSAEKVYTGMFMSPVALTAGNLSSHVHHGGSGKDMADDAVYPPGGPLRATNTSGAHEVDYFPIGVGPLNLLHSGYLGAIVNVDGSSNHSRTTANKSAAHEYGLIKNGVSSHSDVADDDTEIVLPRGAVLTNWSALRTYYHYYKPLDGDITYVKVTRTRVPATDGSCIHEDADVKSDVFNFRLEKVGNIGETNGTTFDLIPGHMELYKVWNVFEKFASGGSAWSYSGPTNYTLSVPSLCTGFGNSAVATVSGSSVPGLAGFAGTIGTIPENAAHPGFVNSTWLDYLETRLGGMPDRAGGTGEEAEPSDILRWRNGAAKVFIYDQDVLDKSEGLLGALLYITYGIATPGQMTYAAVLSNNGEVDWEMRDSYGWGSPVAAVSEDFLATESQTGDVEPLH
jgi:hypothetical protein